jgi:beta-lactamase regulating signal transducer with metallopeptidase domain
MAAVEARHAAIEPAASGMPTSVTFDDGASPTIHRAASPGLEWQQLAVLLWAIGVGGVGLFFALGLLRLRAVTRDALPADDRLRAQARRLAAEIGVERPLRLLASSGLASPATWGVRRPVIIVPQAVDEWSEERRRLVLAHEIVHVARLDWAWRLLAQLGCCVYWCNPLTWLAARRLRREQELACDLAVVELGTRPSTYAYHLLSIARAAAGYRALPLAALDMARQSQMEGRLMSILADRPSRALRRSLLVPALSVLVALPVLATVQTKAPEAPEAPVAPTRPVLAMSIEPAPIAPVPIAPVPVEPVPVEPMPIEPVLAGAPVAPVAAPGRAAGALAPVAPVAPAAPQAEDARTREIEERIALKAAEIEELVAPLDEELGRHLEEEMLPIIEQMERVELQMRPVQEEMSRLGEEISEAMERQMPEMLEMEALGRKAEAIALEMEERARLSEEIVRAENLDRERLNERVREMNERLAPMHEELEALRERMRERHTSAEEVRARMEPYRLQMEELRQRMEPQRERMEALRMELEPVRERLERVREERMSEIHQRMEVLRRELETLRRERDSESGERESDGQ